MAHTTLKRGRVSRLHRSAPYPSSSLSLPAPTHPTGTWAAEEHDRFLEAMKLFPKGPWKSIADHVATRSVRQVQTHAQKYQEKVVRRMRGLRKPKRKGDDESDEEIGHRVVMGTYGKLRKRKGEASEPTAAGSATPSSTQSQTDRESIQSDSSDESEVETTASSSPRHEIEISVSESAMIMKNASASIHIESFSSLLQQQSPVSSDCIDFTPLNLSELSPGWFYLDELTDKTMDLGDDKQSMVEAPTGLPSLGESLDFFIEYLSIAT